MRRLLGAGHEVACLHRGKTGNDLPVRHITGDRKQLASVDLGGFEPDLVIDMMALTEADARGLADRFKGRRLVVISSADVYRAYGRLIRTEPGEPDPVPLSEDAPLREKRFPLKGLSPLGDEYDKILVERALPTATVLRLPMVFGPGDGQRRLRPYVKRMDDKRPAIILDERLASWRGTWGYVDNVAAWIAKAALADAPGRVYNVADLALATEELVELVARAAGWSGRVAKLPQKRLPPSLTQDVDARQDFVLDAARIRELGDIDAVPFEEGIRRTIEWERAHPPEKEIALDYAAEDALLGG